MRNMLLIVMALVLGSAQMVRAGQFDLGHPTITPIQILEIEPDPESNADRNIEFDALTTFNITVAGIRIDPLQAGPHEIAVDIYTSDGSSRTQVATATISITDVGLDFYDVPIAYTFQAGTRYNLGFRSVTPTGWGRNVYSMELYEFDGGPAYSVDGRVSVLDGGRGFGTDAGLANDVMPHVRLGDDPVVAVEAITWGQTKALYRNPTPSSR